MNEEKILFFIKTNLLIAIDHGFLDIKLDDVTFDCKLHEKEKTYYLEMIISYKEKEYRHMFLIGSDLDDFDFMRVVAGTTTQILNIIESTLKGAQTIIRVVK